MVRNCMFHKYCDICPALRDYVDTDSGEITSVCTGVFSEGELFEPKDYR